LPPPCLARTTSLKGDAAKLLPAHVASALLAALKAIPPRGTAGWPILDEEAWWLDVLHDPRARWPSEKRLSATGRYAHLRLDRFGQPLMTLVCRRCDLRKSFDTAEVLRQFGEDYNVTRLRHALVPCHRRGHDVVFEACHLDYER
jgi:hypothetical protein